MKIEGRKVIVNKSVKELYQMLHQPEAYRDLMPEQLDKFQVEENGFKFSLKGMPEIALLIDKVEDSLLVLKSANPNLNFTLNSLLEPLNENQTQVQIFFQGEFNMFMKMMIENPIKNFIAELTNKIEKL